MPHQKYQNMVNSMGKCTENSTENVSLLRKRRATKKRRATRGEEGGRPPLPFFENQKKCLDFGKKGPDFVHP